MRPRGGEVALAIAVGAPGDAFKFSGSSNAMAAVVEVESKPLEESRQGDPATRGKGAR
jgi:hypothetical protein